MKKRNSKSEPFAATRSHHDTEIAEDYVEIIADLLSLKGKAKVCDIANHLGVSHVTVIRTLERLKKKGYVCADPHQPVTLTKEGEELAVFSKKRHEFLMEYLLTLGVPQQIAAIDVEGMEHHISETTIAAFDQHLQRLKKAP